MTAPGFDLPVERQPLSANVRALLGQRLRAAYADVVSAQPPEPFGRLLARIAEQERTERDCD